MNTEYWNITKCGVINSRILVWMKDVYKKKYRLRVSLYVANNIKLKYDVSRNLNISELVTSRAWSSPTITNYANG